MDHFDALCERFQAAWSSGSAPAISEFLQRADSADDNSVHRLLVELVKIDIYHRWQLASQDAVPAALAATMTREVGAGAGAATDLPRRPRLEDYASAFPVLFPVASLSLELVAEEYLARARWDQPPAHTEYVERFGLRQGDVVRRLAELDVELGQQTDTGGSLSAEIETHGPPQPAVTGHSPTPAQPPNAAAPQQIGRYRIDRVLGEGAFGRVYEGFDTELKRSVAIKVPKLERVSRPEDVEQYLTEAQTVAGLDHPGVVPVYDVGRTGDGLCYVVSKLIVGTDLAAYAKQQSSTLQQVAQLVAEVAEVLQYVHTQGLVHRDIKPANILLDGRGRPCVTDFGLALKDEDFGKEAGTAGTPAYMSPEQARGESHLVDGRSDLFSLGVVLYELLTGVRPFVGRNWGDVLQQVMTVEARPLRQRNAAIPPELERICLKALSKRAADRYSCAADLAEDLRHWQQAAGDRSGARGRESSAGKDESLGRSPGPKQTSDPAVMAEPAPLKIVPKGLRSFDADDSDFFLELLPGPRDRDGLPESLRFWKKRIEETDPDHTFRVGLIYGPSGCGKSSLVKAGLLPRLADPVLRVLVESTAQDTEARLLAGLREVCSLLSREAGLLDALATLRRGKELPAGRKVLLVLDQFEQWLHAHGSEPNTELAAALRQCDGERVQAVLLVRDDFWMPATRFLRDLEVRLIEGDNTAAVDLFDPLHARKVLAEFGKAYGRLPENLGELAAGEQEFLDRAVEGLAEDGKVICVRLALFADMMKGRPWTPAALHDVGGTAGVGVTFLEETFSARTAPPEHRLHERAARAVLAALLPGQGTDIKGHMRSYEDLLAASGYARRPDVFADLIRILDSEIRLVTPTSPEGLDDGDADGVGSLFRAEADECGTAQDRKGLPTPSLKSYQLTHDYLVPALREWLTRKQKETRRGRAELRLAERAALWNAKPESRHLTSAWEDLSIRLLTRRKNWTASQAKLMRAAARHHALRTVALLLILTGLVWGGFEGYSAVRASTLVRALATAETQDVPKIVEDLARHRRWANPRLVELLKNSEPEAKEHLHASLALVSVDPSQVDYLKQRLLQAAPQQVPVLREALAAHQDQVRAELWRVLEQPAGPAVPQTLPAAGALALYEPNSNRWKGTASRVADALVAVNPVYLGPWLQNLAPVRQQLLDPLSAIYLGRDGKRSESERDLATNILADFAADQPQTLAALVVSGDPKQFNGLFPAMEKHGAQAVALLDGELDRKLEPDWQDPPRDPAWKKPDPKTIEQIVAAQGLLDDRLAFCQTMPLAEFVPVAEALRPTGYRPVRFRPYAAGDVVQVAAVWTRDGREWRLDHGLDVEQMRQREATQAMDGFMPVDVAGYVTNTTVVGKQAQATPPDADPTGAVGLVEHYAALWVRRLPDEPEARMFVGASTEDLKSVYQALEKEGFVSQPTLQAFRGVDGAQRYCAVKRKGGEKWVDIRNAPAGQYEGAEHRDQTQVDINLSPADNSADSPPRLRQQLAEAEKQLAANPEDLLSRLARAECLCYLGEYELALGDLTRLIDADANLLSAYRLRALIYALMGDVDKAKTDVAQLERLGVGTVERDGWQAVCVAAASEAGQESSSVNTPDVPNTLSPKTTPDPVDVVDLLPFVDPKTDAVSGTWMRTRFGLVSPVAFGARIELPLTLPKHYTLRLVVTPTPNAPEIKDKGLMVGLVMGLNRFQATIDFSGMSALENLEGKKIGQNPTTYREPVLTDGQTAIIEYEVDDRSVQVRRNGQTIIDWHGEPSQLTLDSYWRTPHENLAYIGAYRNQLIVHGVTICLHEGRGKPLRDVSNVESLQKARWCSLVAAVYDARKNTKLATRYRKQVAELLTDAVRAVPMLAQEMQDDPALAAVPNDVEPKDQVRYAAVWQDGAPYDVQELHGLTPQEHLERCRQLLQEVYRPVAMSAVMLESKGLLSFAASVWHRPLIAEEAKETLAKRQANAAIGLLRMSKAERVWPLLQHQPDPRLRTWLIHRFSPQSVDAAALVDRLQHETDVSIRQALILSLGEYDAKDLAPLTTTLLGLYRDDPDPGIHAAAEWLLRCWGQADELANIDLERSKGKIEGDRQWYLNGQGQTLVVIRGPVEFQMGSPRDEAGRSSDENLHRRQIERTYAIANKEVTVAQFKRFQPDFGHEQMHRCPEPSCPILGVTWYEAAQYCNWLSQQEGVVADQQCYLSNVPGQFAEGMKLAANWLARTGYRLPTESEWEYACRADTSTRYGYGQTTELLGRYAWYFENGKERSWPVGQLRPNGWGLFDMQGNAFEWCQDWYGSYGNPGLRLDDGREVAGGSDWVVRGGSWGDGAKSCRSADRGRCLQSYRCFTLGFRVARSLSGK